MSSTNYPITRSITHPQIFYGFQLKTLLKVNRLVLIDYFSFLCFLDCTNLNMNYGREARETISMDAYKNFLL